jgi:hypothetical protein
VELLYSESLTQKYSKVLDLAANNIHILVVLEERGVHEALSDAGSAGREGRENVAIICTFL